MGRGNKPGVKKTGGRTKGTPNKITTSVKEALEYAFAGMGGAPALLNWAKQNEADFFRLWIKMLPAEHKVTLDLDDRFAQEVRERLDEVDAADGGFAGEAGGVEPQDVGHAAAPEVGEQVSGGDGEGASGPAVNPDAPSSW